MVCGGRESAGCSGVASDSEEGPSGGGPGARLPALPACDVPPVFLSSHLNCPFAWQEVSNFYLNILISTSWAAKKVTDI